MKQREKELAQHMQDVAQEEEKAVAELIIKKMDTIKTTDNYLRNTGRELATL